MCFFSRSKNTSILITGLLNILRGREWIQYLGVVNTKDSSIDQQSFANINSGGFPCITCIFLEGKTKNRNFLSSNCVEQGGHNSFDKSIFLPIVHQNHLYMYREIYFQYSIWIKLGECIAKEHGLHHFTQTTVTDSLLQYKGGKGFCRNKDELK